MLNEAVAKYVEAASRWRATGERPMEVSALMDIGSLFILMNDRKHALEYFNQALSLARRIKDRLREAHITSTLA